MDERFGNIRNSGSELKILHQFGSDWPISNMFAFLFSLAPMFLVLHKVMEIPSCLERSDALHYVDIRMSPPGKLAK